MNPMNLAYPIGKFEAPAHVDANLRSTFVAQIAEAPSALRRVVERLSESQLDTPYREGGWTVRQVVHHLPDSHLNAYVRFKLALTEETPTIRPYEQAAWAQMPEARSGPVALSLDLLDALHRRWVACMQALPAESFARTLYHPEQGTMSLDRLLALYAWHGRHHIAHVAALAAREGWS